MKNIYLLIFTMYIFNTYAYNQFQYVHNDNDINAVFHEQLIESYSHRDRRDVRAETAIAFDGSGDTSSVTITTTTATTTTFTTGISIIIQTTEIITRTTTATTTTQTRPSITQLNCNPLTEVQLLNLTCVSKSDAQMFTVNLLRSRTANATIVAYSLSVYISSITSTNISSNPSYILSPNEMDEFVGSLSNTSVAINSTSAFIMTQQLNQYTNLTNLGASFSRGIGGHIVNNSNNNVLSLNSTGAALFTSQSFGGITSLNMLIIDQPLTYENIDSSSGKTLASSVIVVAVQKNSSASISPNISLSFRVLNEYRPSINARYLCSFYDTNTTKWNESGCTAPQYNQQYDRYDCSCNHLTTFALLWVPSVISCNTSTQVLLSNGTCISNSDGQMLAVDTLRSNSSNSTTIAQFISLYISATTTPNATSDSSYTLSLHEIDTYLGAISNVSLAISTDDSYLLSKPPYGDDNVIILGASFTRGIGGDTVNTSNQDNVISSPLSAAANISKESLVGVISLNMLIIDKPSAFTNIDNSSNKTLASSIIMASVRRNSSRSASIDISLFFQVLDEFKPNMSATYLCSFYDANTSQWNESGCTTLGYNSKYDRYECKCNHLTSFALIWLPQSLLTSTSTKTLNAQDIASLVFQSLSILSFLAIIIHAIYRRISDPLTSSNAYNLLPLFSGASTTVLFIFYIALGMTVYTKTSSSDETKCFLSSSVLMFFVYFLLIFMFCVKTSVGYFNYLRFVHLFPQPSHRKLMVMLLISFFISITWVSFAAGFSSNASYNITQLYPYKLCWFSHNVIYYFLTIPACVFLLVNIILFVLVARNIINHVRNSTSPHPSYDRMKECIIVLLSSCITQGIGWLFGPFISFINPTAGDVLGWFFIVFNGLEGVWSVVVYIIVRHQKMDVPVRIQGVKELLKQQQRERVPEPYEVSSKENDKERRNQERDNVVKGEDDGRERSDLHYTVRDSRDISSSSDDDRTTYF